MPAVRSRFVALTLGSLLVLSIASVLASSVPADVATCAGQKVAETVDLSDFVEANSDAAAEAELQSAIEAAVIGCGGSTTGG